MKKIIPLFFISILPFSGFCQGENENNPDITSNEIKSHIKYLASDELKGRFTGSEECYTAAEYIQKEFSNYGLVPLFDNGFIQPFSFISGVELSGENYLEFNINNEKLILNISEEYVNASFSGNVNVESNLVFAGYGLSTPSLNYDDYENIDVKDKIVLVLRYN